MRGALGSIVVAAFVMTGLVVATLGPADARRRGDGGDSAYGGRVPELDVKGSCSDAQKFSTGSEKSMAYKGCLQDEMQAKSELAKRWSGFKAKDRSNCVEQSRFPSPSYVEVLTCLEMDNGAISNAPRSGAGGSSQIGGPVAPGLTDNPAPVNVPPAMPPSQ